MWNSDKVFDYKGMLAETVGVVGHGGKPIHAYYSRPLGKESFPGIVLIPHMPGWDEWCRETARRFTDHGYGVVCPNIYEDYGDGTAPEVSQKAMKDGGVADKDVMEDVAGCLSFLRSQANASGKVGVIGMCSGGRHTFLAAATLDGIDAAVDCWGGSVVCAPERLSPKQPVAPVDLADGIDCPLLGIFGNDDMFPPPQDVDTLEAVLREKGKDYEFHRYDGAGHGIWYYDKPMYRQEQAMDSWNKALAFFDRHLKGT